MYTDVTIYIYTYSLIYSQKSIFRHIYICIYIYKCMYTSVYDIEKMMVWCCVCKCISIYNSIRKNIHGCKYIYMYICTCICICIFICIQVPGSARPTESSKKWTALRNQWFIGFFEMQKPWSFEAARRVSEWTHGGRDANKVTEPMNQWISKNKWVNHWINETTNQWMSEPMIQ